VKAGHKSHAVLTYGMPQNEEPKKGQQSDLDEGETQEQLPLYAKPDELSLRANPDNRPKALPRFLRRMGWTPAEWETIRNHWLERPEDLTKRDHLVWANAKIERYNEASKLAIERQQRLRSDEWMTAFLLARDWDPQGIADSLVIELGSVYKLIREIKNKADVNTQPGIIRWFLGL
jgi:hypothetical protein